MDLEPTADQVALVEELRRMLAARVPAPALVTPELWTELAEMGILALPLPEDRGGVGLGWAEAALAFQELGRSGLAGPFVATAVATAAGVADGVTGLLSVADAPPGPVVVEHLDQLDSLLVVDRDQVRRVPLPLDGARPAPRPLDPLTPVHVADALPAGEPVGDETTARDLARSAGVLVAAQQVGLATAALDMATTYALQRQQFGRVIGSFQALKHLLADAAVGIEVARAAVDAAAVMLDEQPGLAASRAAASARVVASGAAQRATEACIQVHGGMGYTWELAAHLYFKRVVVLDQALPSVDAALDHLAAVA